jgi:Domain of unknown function (DUF4907)
MKTMNKYLSLFLLFVFFSNSCKNLHNNSQKSLSDYTPVLSYKIINASNNTYGYSIYADGKLIIHQPHSTPTIRGIDGFKSNERATKVANLVIQKIKKGQMPPIVTIDELKKLDRLQ